MLVAAAAEMEGGAMVLLVKLLELAATEMVGLAADLAVILVATGLLAQAEVVVGAPII
jgi:hypothetical protein